MNPFVRILTLTFALALGAASAGAQTRVTIKSDRTNVRAKPALDSEILASLNKGQEVVALGEIIPAKSQETWTRIALPASVTVWVYGQLVDTKAGTVKAKELNYRAGPGRNYSVLGELKRGDRLQVIREFDGWVQIEPPANAVAFVASRLLSTEPAKSAQPPPAVPPASVPSRVSTPPPVVEPPSQSSLPAAIPSSVWSPTRIVPPITPDPVPVPPPTPPTAPAEEPPTPAASVTEPPAVSPSVEEFPVASPSVPEPPAALNSTTYGTERPFPLGSPRARNILPPVPSPNVLLTEVPPRLEVIDAEPRFVVREGNVEPTISIQAPTNYELRDGFYREGALNYLLLEPQKDLRQYSGKRVLVSGYEYRDSRWRLPVLKVENIQLLP